MALGFSKDLQLGKKTAGTNLASNEQKQSKIKAKTAGHHKPLKLMSKKQKKELAKRAKLKAELIEESGGLCMRCGKPPDMKDGKGKLHLIHKISLAQGGKTNRENCEVWCRKEHMSEFHGIREV